MPPAGGTKDGVTPHPALRATFPSRGRLTGVRPAGAPVSLRVGRFAGLTGHRPVIQYREPPRGKANGGTSSYTASPARGRLVGTFFYKPIDIVGFMCYHAITYKKDMLKE